MPFQQIFRLLRDFRPAVRASTRVVLFLLAGLLACDQGTLPTDPEDPDPNPGTQVTLRGAVLEPLVEVAGLNVDVYDLEEYRNAPNAVAPHASAVTDARGGREVAELVPTAAVATSMGSGPSGSASAPTCTSSSRSLR